MAEYFVGYNLTHKAIFSFDVILRRIRPNFKLIGCLLTIPVSNGSKQNKIGTRRRGFTFRT